MQTILACADALVARGQDVRIATTADGPVTWRSSRARWEFVDDLAGVRADIDESFPWQDFLIVDDAMYGSRARENTPLRVLLDGATQNDDSIDLGYGAAAHARWFHQQFDLVRVSPWVPSREEPLDSVQEFHVGLATHEMTRLMQSCDVLIAPRLGLRSAEAMAAGVAVANVAAENAVELGERLIEIVSDGELRDQLRQRGREAAEQWRAACVAPRLEAFLAR